MAATHLKSIALFTAFCLTTLFYSCRQDTCKPAPDVSDIDLEVNIHRFDQDFFNTIDTNDIEGSLAKLKEQYPIFASAYLEYLNFDALGVQRLVEGLHYNDPISVLEYFQGAGYDVEAMTQSIKEGRKKEIGSTSDFIELLGFNPETIYDTLSQQAINGFVNFSSTKSVYDTIQTAYSDLSDLEAELTQAFKYYNHYFPDKKIPKIVSMYSEFTNPVISIDEDIVAISLEWFFGVDYPAYYQMGNATPQYLARTLYRDHITSKVMQNVINLSVSDSTVNSLLDYMIMNGKKLYLLDKFLPCTPEYIKLECNPDQAEWLNQNEMNMWSEVFVDKLYDTNYKDFQKYIGPSPHSPGMPMEAPGNTGSFIGWKIVEAFMERNPNYKPEQMLQITDGQEFLKLAKYKPSK